MKNILKIVVFLVSSQSLDVAAAQEVVHYSESTKTVQVSSRAKTLLSFPSPPLSSACQPSGYVSLPTVERGEDEFENQVIAKTLEQRVEKDLQPQNDIMSKMLKLVPVRNGETTCAFRLANGESFQIRFQLSNNIIKPSVEFRSIYSNAKKFSEVTKVVGGINVFRSLVKGGNLTFLTDVTPRKVISRKDGEDSEPYVISTANASYRLEYLGTDQSRYRAWRFLGEAKKTITPPAPLKAKIGEIYFSAYARFDANDKTKKVYQPGDKFYLFVLTRADIDVKEMEEKLL